MKNMSSDRANEIKYSTKNSDDSLSVFIHPDETANRANRIKLINKFMFLKLISHIFNKRLLLINF